MSSTASTPLTGLMTWYHDQCDGDWEHQYGITIETLDNPGWRLAINLTGTGLDNRHDFAESIEMGSEYGWIAVKKAGTTFEGACGPLQLENLINRFFSWKDTDGG